MVGTRVSLIKLDQEIYFYIEDHLKHQNLKNFIFILQTDLENFRWEFKERKNNWKNFFNQGGITQITKSDFERIIEIL